MLIVAAVVVWMMLDSITLSLEDKTWPPKHDSEIMLDDEYVELLDLPKPRKVATDYSPAYNETVENNKSEAAPETGMEIVDQGAPAEAPAPVVQKAPSPVKTVAKEKPVKQGPSAEELKKQQEEQEARRKATSQINNAFSKRGQNNTDNKGKEQGNSGTPKGNSASVNGFGHGNATGGWRLPAYKAVPSTVTGSVEMRVTIDRQGNVKTVTFTGGTAPAATDPAVRAACEKEVRARKFTRSDNEAPDEATAFVTYIFR